MFWIHNEYYKDRTFMGKMRKAHIWNEKGWGHMIYYFKGSEKNIIQDLWLLCLKKHKKLLMCVDYRKMKIFKMLVIYSIKIPNL